MMSDYETNVYSSWSRLYSLQCNNSQFCMGVPCQRPSGRGTDIPCQNILARQTALFSVVPYLGERQTAFSTTPSVYCHGYRRHEKRSPDSPPRLTQQIPAEQARKLHRCPRGSWVRSNPAPTGDISSQSERPVCLLAWPGDGRVLRSCRYFSNIACTAMNQATDLAAHSQR